MTKDEALKLALETLERCVATCFDPYAHDQVMSWPEHFVNQTITAIKEALAQPEQEPVAWMNDSTPSGIFARHIDGAKNFGCTIPLYITPPQRTWVGLTDDEWLSLGCKSVEEVRIGLAIQDKLKEKNA